MFDKFLCFISCLLVCLWVVVMATATLKLLTEML